MPFMLTYAAVDYAYFALAMSFDKRNAREAKFRYSLKSFTSFNNAIKKDVVVHWLLATTQ